MSEKIKHFREKLGQPVDAINLGCFRMCFGLIIIFFMYRYRSAGIMQQIYLSSDFHFSYPLFHWLNLPKPTLGLLTVLRTIIGVSGVLIALGLFYRTAAAFFIGSFGYMFLLEKTYYSNHHYLLLLFSFLFIFTQADRFGALGPKLFRQKKPGYVPYWNVFIFQILLCLVFFFGGLAKLNPDWLSGKVAAIMFKGADMWFFFFVAMMGALIDLTLGFLLMGQKNRRLGIFTLLVFSIFLKYMLDIEIFPYFLIACAILFIKPQAIRKVLNLYRPKDRQLGYQSLDSGHSSMISTGAFALICLFMFIQATVPLRHWAHPGSVSWNRVGDRFSWRMYGQKNLGHIDFFVTDLITGETIEVPRLKGIDAAKYLQMAQIPDMILQYANYLHGRYEQEGMYNPLVTVNSFVSKNGRGFSMFVNPMLNLVHGSINPESTTLIVPWSDAGPAVWIKSTDVARFYSAAYQLTVIDQQGLVPGDHPYIAEMNDLINQLTVPQQINDYQVSNLVAEIKAILYTEYGRTLSSKEILGKLIRAFSGVQTMPVLDEALPLFI